MGVPAKALTRILALHRAGLIHSGQSMLELGEQNLNCNGQEAIVSNFVSVLSNKKIKQNQEINELASRGLAGDLFEMDGLSVTCLDIFAGKRTVITDLNTAPPPDDFIGRFDIVTNFGTTEHIINQYNAFHYIHHCVRKDGLMIHQLPVSGWRDHCLVQYNPKFFFLLALANDYTLVDFRINIGLVDQSDVSYWNTLQGNILGPKSDIGQAEQTKGCFFVLQKTHDKPFKVPMDKTSGTLSADELKPLRRF